LLLGFLQKSAGPAPQPQPDPILLVWNAGA